MLNSIVTIVCITLIAFILFWFFKKPEKSGQKAQQKKGYQEIRVEVMGGYTPELIILKKSVPARIVFPDFGVHADLPMGEEYVVEITPEQAGEYGFSCGMNMMHGKMIVE